jgi:hypothetical protein
MTSWGEFQFRMDQTSRTDIESATVVTEKTSNSASIRAHIIWVRRDIEIAERNIKMLEDACARSTDAQKIERFDHDIAASRELISELDEVLLRYENLRCLGPQ